MPTLFAERFAAGAGIVDLMADLGEALNVNPDMLFLGGGNPALIPKFEQHMARILAELSADAEALHRLLGVYQSPQGSETLIRELVSYFQGLGWPLTEENICLTSGSQTAFFMLFNLLAGPLANGQVRKILIPMLPEYLGYSNQGVADTMFRVCAPCIENVGEHEFKYHCDFEHVQRQLECGDIGALCVSRPTNPSGNVHTLQTMAHLGELADKYRVPLIVDAAYGLPFPGIVYDGEPLLWQTNRIFVLSLSKLGLPGVRTGIVVGDAPLIKKISATNTVLSLANGNLGPALFERLLASGQLDELSQREIRPYYQQKKERLLGLIAQYWHGFPYRVHKAQGALFLWLWFPELPIQSAQLYERLKQRNLLVMDGAHFFFDEPAVGAHAHQCLRLSYCADDHVLEQAVLLMAQELSAIYAEQ